MLFRPHSLLRFAVRSYFSVGPVSGFEQFDEVARRIADQDLPSAGARDHVTAKVETSASQPSDLGIEVVHHQMDPVTSGGGRVVGSGTCS